MTGDFEVILDLFIAGKLLGFGHDLVALLFTVDRAPQRDDAVGRDDLDIMGGGRQ